MKREVCAKMIEVIEKNNIIIIYPLNNIILIGY